MKMQEFLELPEDEKVAVMEKNRPVDAGQCFYCGGEATVADYCFGCHRLVCPNCGQDNPEHKCW